MTEHATLLQAFFRLHHGSWASYQRESSVLWEGEHLIVVRTGLDSNRCRYTYLVDKVGLLLNEQTHALKKLAAGYHPSQNEAAKAPLCLHVSGDENATAIFRGRWCKRLCAQVVVYAKTEDARYLISQEDIAEAYEAKKRREQEQHARRQIFTDEAASLVRTRIGLKQTDDIYRFDMPNGSNVRCYIRGECERIELDDLRLTFKQFSKLVDLLKEEA